MATPKSKKTAPWVECDSCGVTFLNKDVETHFKECPPDPKKKTYSYIKNGILSGSLDVKKNEEIKGMSTDELDNLVFLSQSAMQLCNLSIAEWVVIEAEGIIPISKIVWPTMEKSLSSVLLTKNALDLLFGNMKLYPPVTVRKLFPVKDAQSINVVSLGAAKSINFDQVLVNRLSNTFRGSILGLDTKVSIFYFGKILKFVVKSIKAERNSLEKEFESLSISEDRFYRITKETNWFLYRDKDEFLKQNEDQVCLSKVGGLNEEINEIKEILNASLNAHINMKLFKPINSVLLYGSSGTGKTMLAISLAKESRVNMVLINASDIHSKYSSSPNESIKELFDTAIQNSPTVIILDEVDLLCPSRSSRITDSEKKIVSTLLTCLDDLNGKSDSRVFVIATTNKLDSIDPCFRKRGRFEREIEIPTPNPKSRKDIIEKLLFTINNSLSEDELLQISHNTHGFVGADLVSLCSMASLHSYRNNRNIIEFRDFEYAMVKVRPSAMREVQIEVPNVKWNDIAGQENLKLILRQAVEWPLTNPESFVRLGITPPRGVLMFGPPGCSKTMIAKALATESKLNFISIKGPELFSKWVGESERAVREVFRKARQVAPSIIFFDEIDALGGERSSGSSTSVQERVLAQLLIELDGVTPLKDVTILAATNRPDRIDKALLRPGRLDRIVYVPLPDKITRSEIFKLKMRKMPTENVDIDYLVNLSEGYSGAEVNAVCHEAAMKALEENIDAKLVNMDHFRKAFGIITPRTPRSLIKLYEEYVSRT
ncbi:hypothetical protein WA026_016174 [Henosepilachna vigintioctopunctata]|uniref:AAA+ ATPase domain-containing protein n=1 Tax=Henosepilachna vigintioctopunctata TaxID=420089 RepID=A0AAW1TUX0_9CUCU